ncbi:LacI family DNA-binding transcriptional regulator (plasmid) [Roseomonas sp. OT10]|uniref:LacI family DNA-binding transcriptional regulator n=1 Tax=Roseomonas cutis TaxID=2897332 RepID=UPI001E411D78|nr:LacI family DNA-binding transcriptional regulator [Roseomonas sp. OT10]UFN51652.1 LacI family DNA-binding transcriptional regulator [Roseomonas sp. OT10]
MSGEAGTFRRVTAMDVAREAGTSQSAVSRVFTPGASVSPELRDKVMAVSRRLGYRPNAIARSLITRRSRMVGVAMAYLNNQFYPDVLEALSNRLQKHGYQILLFTPDKLGSADPMVDQVMRYQVDAVVMASASLSSAFARECRRLGVPVVLFNRVTEDPEVSSVTGDNERGGRAIAHFLAEGGHRRPAFMAGLEESSTNRDRERGFHAGLATAGFGPPLREIGYYSYEGASEAARRLLRRPDRPDAIFCANDHMAIACIEVARHEFGLDIPRDLSVVGFDDVGPARWKSFDLTSFSQPMQPMVDATVGMLMEFIENPAQPTRRVVVGGELVIRGSARRP